MSTHSTQTDTAYCNRCKDGMNCGTCNILCNQLGDHEVMQLTCGHAFEKFFTVPNFDYDTVLIATMRVLDDAWLTCEMALAEGETSK